MSGATSAPSTDGGVTGVRAGSGVYLLGDTEDPPGYWQGDLYIDVYHEVPDGGTTGQVLAKVSGDDYDVDWATPDAAVTSVVAVATALQDYTGTDLVDDVDLTTYIGVGTWEVAVVASFSTTGSNTGLRFSASFTGTATTILSSGELKAQNGTSFLATDNSATTHANAVTSANALTLSPMFYRETLVVTVAGVFTLRCAQQTNNANPTRRLAGAYLRALKLA